MYEYISLHLVDSYGQWVGKYTSLMDPMGYSYISTHIFFQRILVTPKSHLSKEVRFWGMDAFQPKLRAGGIGREEKEAPGKQPLRR